jgi:hypothetical protein
MCLGGQSCPYVYTGAKFISMGNGPKRTDNKMSVNTVSITTDADVSFSSIAVFQLDEVKDIPLNYDFSDTKTVMVDYIKLSTNLSVGNEYANSGIHHSFFLRFHLILKNGNLGAYSKIEYIKRSHLVQLIGENIVADLESANTVALQNRLQELLGKVGA